MKRLILLFGLLIFFSNIAYAQVEYPYGVSAPTDADLKDLQWNRYTTENFVILSIDNAQGKWLSKNIEHIKKECLSRWGFPENSRGKFTKECRVFCVPDKTLLKKLFALDQSKVEARKKEGRLEMTALWLVLDDKPSKTIPEYLSQVCFSEFESANNVSLGFWFKRGASLLNGTIPDIRQEIVNLSSVVGKDQPIFPSDKMFSMTQEDYLKETNENKKIFDQEAIALCLLLRKEFGEAKLQGMLRLSSKNSTEDVLRAVYGFSGYSHFDKQYIRFMRDLTDEVAKGKTPDSYLEVKPVR